ncbi:MAG TPA: hypothetical protein VGQ99_18640 [Tepidisphaeraceae bacterium]|jgi:hypothetical protein|nr:hypothetical protein [Tepidisphaeraceae bacterium]
MKYTPLPSLRTGRIGILLLLCSICGCSSPPRAELSAYKTQFETAKTTAEDLILSTKNAAEALADDPSNPASVTDRTRQLKERLDALDARLEALQVVAQYNDALARLASGEDPAAVKASLDNFASGLASFNIKGLSKLVADVAPYGNVFASAVTLVDNLIQAKRFAAAIEAGEKPVLAILDILSQDADNFFNIAKARLQLLQADPQKQEAQLLANRFATLANAHPFSEATLSPRFKSLLAAHGKLRQGISQPFAHNPAAGAAPNQDDLALESLATINDQMQSHVTAYNTILAQIDAQAAVIKQYKNVLASTQRALTQVRIALKSGRSAAVMGFINDVYNLRQAYLAAREAKTK